MTLQTIRDLQEISRIPKNKKIKYLNIKLGVKRGSWNAYIS
jgi:hypothetical protein